MKSRFIASSVLGLSLALGVAALGCDDKKAEVKEEADASAPVAASATPAPKAATPTPSAAVSATAEPAGMDAGKVAAMDAGKPASASADAGKSDTAKKAEPAKK